jgi:drug/metabolite transporter (DMT)-like permease
MQNVEPRSLLPERPTPESWFLFVAVGLIGVILVNGPLASGAESPLALVQAGVGALLAGFALPTVCDDARRLDDMEGSR